MWTAAIHCGSRLHDGRYVTQYVVIYTDLSFSFNCMNLQLIWRDNKIVQPTATWPHAVVVPYVRYALDFWRKVRAFLSVNSLDIFPG
jgi:hypothetical protein